MAELKNGHVDIALSNPYSNGEEKSEAMPRMDRCHNCGYSEASHANGKCLFASTEFKAVDQDYVTFRAQFMSWAQGQKLEDAFCNIVYELTRRDR